MEKCGRRKGMQVSGSTLHADKSVRGLSWKERGERGSGRKQVMFKGQVLRFGS